MINAFWPPTCVFAWPFFKSWLSFLKILVWLNIEKGAFQNTSQLVLSAHQTEGKGTAFLRSPRHLLQDTARKTQDIQGQDPGRFGWGIDHILKY